MNKEINEPHALYCFTGGDFHAMFVVKDDTGERGIRITNLESVQWKVRVSEKGETVWGRLILNQYQNHPLFNVIFGGKYKTLSEIPPFDIIITGIHKAGLVSATRIRGVRIRSETGGMSMCDVGSAIGLSFRADSIDPWERNDEVAYVASQVVNV